MDYWQKSHYYDIDGCQTITVTNMQKTIIPSHTCEYDETHVDPPLSRRNGILQVRVKARRHSDTHLDKTLYAQSMITSLENVSYTYEEDVLDTFLFCLS